MANFYFQELLEQTKKEDEVPPENEEGEEVKEDLELKLRKAAHVRPWDVGKDGVKEPGNENNLIAKMSDDSTVIDERWIEDIYKRKKALDNRVMPETKLRYCEAPVKNLNTTVTLLQINPWYKKSIW